MSQRTPKLLTNEKNNPRLMVENPLTGRPIQLFGPRFNELVSMGFLRAADYLNPTTIESRNNKMIKVKAFVPDGVDDETDNEDVSIEKDQLEDEKTDDEDDETNKENKEPLEHLDTVKVKVFNIDIKEPKERKRKKGGGCKNQGVNELIAKNRAIREEQQRKKAFKQEMAKNTERIKKWEKYKEMLRNRRNQQSPLNETNDDPQNETNDQLEEPNEETEETEFYDLE